MTKLLLIDLDGTARRTISGQVCPTYPKDQVLIAKTANLCQRLKAAHWVIVAVTNQGGCEDINPDTGKPYKTHLQAVAECKYFLDIAPWCDWIYMCPNGKMSDRDEVYRVSRCSWLAPFRKYSVVHEHNDDHPHYQTQGYRKPKPGMLELAIRDQEGMEYAEARSLGIRERDMEIDVKALMVGDMESDWIAASALKLPYLPVKEFQLETVESLERLLDISSN